MGRRWLRGLVKRIHALGAARSLNVISVGLDLRRPQMAKFIDRHASRVEKWMTGLAPKSLVI